MQNEVKVNRLYLSPRWRKARAAFLTTHPLCALCAKIGRDTAATTVHHKIPHKGDEGLFWDQSKWESSCTPCHSRHQQTKEKSGMLPGCDVSGFPLDAQHPWNRKETR
jgi:5-methylcytosine-specific restriction protein A